MKALNQLELDSLVHDLNENLKEAQLQDCTSWENGLILWHFRRGSKNLLLDFSMTAPFFFLQEKEWQFAKRRKPFPVNLFLNSHARNLYFESAKILSEFGRVIEIIYQNKSKKVRLQFNLIPKQVNFCVEAEGKSIHFSKPRELKPAQDVDLSEVEVRSHRALLSEWALPRLSAKEANQKSPNLQGSPASATSDPARAQIEKNISKKKKAISAIEDQIQSYDVDFWKNLGDKVKEQGLNTLEGVEKTCLEDCPNIGAAIQKCFVKYKSFQQKIIGSRLRQQKVLQEISELENRLQNFNGGGRNEKNRGVEELDSKRIRFKDLHSKSEKSLKVRKLELTPQIQAYIGKSALENLSLLRQARAWDYWLHLKDYPGAYGIIRREKNESISMAQIQEVAAFVAKNSSTAEKIAMGQRLSVVYVECRHVRPIKGAKPGVVTYSHAKEVEVEF